MRGINTTNHDCLISEMRKLHHICRIRGEHAGVHILVEMKNGMTEQEAVEAARKAGIKVYGLTEYCIRPLKDRKTATVLMGYATLSEEQIKEAVQLLAEVWGDYQ